MPLTQVFYINLQYQSVMKLKSSDIKRIQTKNCNLNIMEVSEMVTADIVDLKTSKFNNWILVVF